MAARLHISLGLAKVSWAQIVANMRTADKLEIFYTHTEAYDSRRNNGMVYLCLTKCKALEDSKETDFGQHPVEFALKSGKSCLMWHFLVFIIIIPYFFFGLFLF